MEQKVNEIISKIMKSKNISPDDLNKIIELHENISNQKFKYQKDRNKLIDDISKRQNGLFFEEKSEEISPPVDESYIFERQIKRLEMALKDKLKQINIYLNDDYLDNLENILFYRNGKANIKDLRLINQNEIAIVRENSIELGDFCHNVNYLSAGLLLQEEAYLQEMSKTKREPDYCNPKEIFSHFYEEMDNKINKLKEKLNVTDRDVEIYFDKDLDEFYFSNLKNFRVILTELPNSIEIYIVDASTDEWIPKKISGEVVSDYLDRINYSLLEENYFITEHKKTCKEHSFGGRMKKFTTEMALDKFKQSPFSLEILINTYNSLFDNNNCMLEENESTINRLKYLVAEKYVEQGLEYEKAYNYANTIFETIKNYKNQIISAINGDNVFPKSSLIGIVKKLEKTNSR